MAIGTNVRVTIYDRNIAALFVPGPQGQVWNWLEMVGRIHMAEALRQAPMRSGHLRSMHNLALTPYKRFGARYSVGNYADYAPYVYFGTTGPIVAGNGFWDDGRRAFLGPMAPWMGYNTLFAPSVDGQDANPWIARAADVALAPYGFTGNPFPY